MAQYAYIGKGIVTLQKGSEAAVDIGNVSALSINITEEKKELKNFRTAGGGTYASVSSIESAGVAMTLHDLSPENLAMVLFGTYTEDVSGTHVIEALTTGAQEFKMEFKGLNEVTTGQKVDVLIHRCKIGATAGLDLIGDDFAALEVDGEILMDTTITTPGKSQFFTVTITDAE